MSGANKIPIVTLIRRNIIDKLSLVKLAGNWACDLFPEALKTSGNPGKPGLVIVQRVGFRQPEDGEALGQTDRVHIFLLTCYVGQSQESDLAIDDKLEQFEADVEKALLQEEASWNRGGYANWTKVSDGEVGFEAESQLDVLSLTVEVMSRTGSYDAYDYE